jgi:hypothetical protein
MLSIQLFTPLRSLNPAYRKAPVSRPAVEHFKTQLAHLFEKAAASMSEETLKDQLNKWLGNQGYEPHYHISENNNRQDLSIHLGRKLDDPVGVIIETKAMGSAEMMSAAKPNTKALHELVLYYLREKLVVGNLELKHLIATDAYQWMIFDANEFDNKIFAHKGIRKLFDVYVNDNKNNDFFYLELKQLLDNSNIQLHATGFSLLSYKNVALNSAREDDQKLLPLLKVLSPQHLLKQRIANDSNSLDKGFYAELLHIIGLEEVKDKGRKLIRRLPEGKRNEASLLENALIKLHDKEALRNLAQAEKQGDSSEEQYYNLALELVITWVNRILFIKLLESQLLSYHGADSRQRFLHTQLIHDFDELNNLFFQVLAELPENRRAALQSKFAAVPYLNSSLFERTDLERKAVDISALDNQLLMPLHKATILKDDKGKRLSGSLKTLEYLFAFLDAYNFSSEGKGDIQEDSKTLINASVLGLLFEKINGYKDGSFFTPGFITMYMCRQTLRRAVLQKFNEVKGWSCASLDELYDKIENRQEANDIINSLRICDPAVGSGHFLVSALNELIAIKHDLKILQDRQGRRLKEYQVAIENDELVVTDEDGNPFAYRPGQPESQRLQETLFHEKQTLIENCLFGVDLNPNSVKICRLRLWIELLKNAYYKPLPQAGIEPVPSALETLPNIDINIKTGNSLVSRFALDASLEEALRNSKWSITTYQLAVSQYKHAQSKSEKRELEELIENITRDFKSVLSFRDKEAKDLVKLRGAVTKLSSEIANLSAFGQVVPKNKFKALEAAIKKRDEAEAKVEEIAEGKFFEQAFEWRIAFPEVLDADGHYIGFDAIIGNPPYIRQEEISWMKPWLQKQYATYSGTSDLYVFFVEKGMQLLKPGGHFCYILPNKWMKGGYGKPLRLWAAQWHTVQMVDFGDLPVFEEATTYPSIWLMQHTKAIQTGFTAAIADTLDYPDGMESYLQSRWLQVGADSLTADSWNLIDSRKQRLLEKINGAGQPLGEYVRGKIYYGIKTGFNEAFVIDTPTKQRLVAEDPRSAEVLKPFLAGRDIKRYQQPVSDKWLILFPNGFTRERFGKLSETEAYATMQEAYPAVMAFMEPFEEKAKARYDQGQFWWEQRPCEYLNEFGRNKIIIPAIVQGASYALDTFGNFSNDKTSIIPGTDLYLLGLLNSRVVDYYLMAIASTKQNGYYEYKPVYVSQLPIASAEGDVKFEIERLVSQILEIKSNDKSADTSGLEQQIDALVYEAYGLEEEEVRMMEGR